MHIKQPRQDFLDAQQTRQSLQQFLLQPVPKETPPCPGCITHIKHLCSADCPEAKTALSTQPKEFPIETNVVPLVFGLMSTCLIQTCWACEGHMDSNNNLIKLPRVSFYTSSPIYPQLLHRHLSKLLIDKQLVYLWNVVLADYAQTWAQTYSVMPDLSLEKNDIHLGALQNDLKIIAQDLQIKMKVIAKEMSSELDKWIEENNASAK